MLLTTKRYMFLIDVDSTIPFSALANVCQPPRNSSPFFIHKTLPGRKSLVSRFLHKFSTKKTACCYRLYKYAAALIHNTPQRIG